MRQFCTIVHFQIASSLCFKARPSSKPLIWKLLFILTQIKLELTTKKFHFVSFLKWGFFKLGNGLLNYLAVEEQLSTCCSFEKKRLFSFQFSTFFPVWKTGLQILRLFFQNSRLGTNSDLRKATYRKPLTVLTWKTFLTISIFSTFVAICCFNLEEREV